MKRSKWISLISALFLFICLNAQALESEIRFDAVTSQLYLQQIEQQLLDMGIDPETWAFKVPATKTSSVICIPVRSLGGSVNPCGETIPVEVLNCPETVPVQDSQGKIHYVPVNCTGPDVNGDCDCEFR